MTPLDPVLIRQSFDEIRQFSAPIVHDLIGTLERRLILDESMLALQSRLDEATDVWSRKVTDTPALRLVGAFACDPDESCGQAS